MKIIYKQTQNSSMLSDIDIKGCYFKELIYENDIKIISKKVHHHTFFEVHVILDGYQTYEIEGKKIKIKSGDILILPPRTKHKVCESDSLTKKVSLIFGIGEKSVFYSFASVFKTTVNSKISARIKDNISYIIEEGKNHLMLSPAITESRVFELIVLVMRLCGFKEHGEKKAQTSEDVRLAIAKQYILDNIEMNLKLSDVASYCYLSTKQLTRLFRIYENTTPALYIQSKKFSYIEKLLSDKNLSLKDISEKMNFSSEYHFNSFFKKIAGTPPGEYRMMMGM